MSSPTVYIWWPQTINPKNEIPNIAYIIPSLPKIELLDYLEITSEIIPKPGKIRIYTSGWPKNQNKCSNNTGEPPW